MLPAATALLIAGVLPQLGAEEQTRPREVRAGTLFRPPDARPQHDDGAASKLEVARYDSRRLKLYTDIDPELARTLPPLVEQAYDALTACFGPMPPSPDGAEFQMTGYLMRDRERFRKLGMLKEDLPQFLHGRHFGAEFWMDDQELPYYREHLLLHEATHCFMTIVPGPPQPLWYLEGMAEFFGAHRAGENGQLTFGVMPETRNEFPGFGRIAVLRREIRENRKRTLSGVLALGRREFSPQTSEPYAWSWGLCLFLDRHPRYRERFSKMHQEQRTQSVATEFWRRFEEDRSELEIEWQQFSHHVVEGYDFERSAISFDAGEPLPASGKGTAAVRADLGWQSTGIRLEPGRRYEVSAAGRVTLGQSTRPWESGPSGISLRYAEGRPIGRLLAAIDPVDATPEERAASLLTIAGEGSAFTVTTPTSGTLYLRVNDNWNSLSDNSGQFEVVIREMAN